MEKQVNQFWILIFVFVSLYIKDRKVFIDNENFPSKFYKHPLFSSAILLALGIAVFRLASSDYPVISRLLVLYVWFLAAYFGIILNPKNLKNVNMKPLYRFFEVFVLPSYLIAAAICFFIILSSFWEA